MNEMCVYGSMTHNIPLEASPTHEDGVSEHLDRPSGSVNTVHCGIQPRTMTPMLPRNSSTFVFIIYLRFDLITLAKH